MLQYYNQGKRRLAVELERFRLERGEARPLDASRALDGLGPSPSVLFLCYGNICRSPMAERYVQARLAESGLEDVSVESAGFHQREGRTSPSDAIAAAREHGVELADHRSKRVTREQFAASDLVVLMDAYNYRQLRREFPSVEPKSYFLKAFAPSAMDGFEVSDPYDADRAEFRRVYDEVTTAADGLVAALDEGSG